MKNRKLYIIAIVPFVLGIIFGSIFDLQINTALYAPNNAFGLAFAAFGPWFGYAYLVLMGGYIHRFAIKEKTLWVKIAYFVTAAVGYGVSTYLSAGKVTSINAFNCGSWLWLWIIIVAILFFGLFYLGDRYGKKNDDKAVLYASLILVGFMLIELIPIAQILKSTMRRPRYRVLAADLYEGAVFKNWWEPFTGYSAIKEAYPTAPSLSEQFKSFPSGHASVAAVLIFGLPYFAMIEPKLKGKETLLFCIGVGFTLLMMLSRMTMGAHYLSDVSFGALAMTLCCIAGNEINLKYILKEKKPEENNN